MKTFSSKLINKLSKKTNQLSSLLFKLSLFINPYTSLNKLDKKLAKLIPEILDENCFFIEVGANDGINQSNTYFLEHIYNARGLLIEASQYNFEKCLSNRSKRNFFEHCALVSSNHSEPFLELIYSNLMSIDSNSEKVDADKHAKKGLEFYKGINYKFLAPAFPLQKLIEKYQIDNVDILSLDVEGNEMNVLNGIDLNQKVIKNILIETWDIKPVNDLLKKFNYNLISQLSKNDYLFTINA